MSVTEVEVPCVDTAAPPRESSATREVWLLPGAPELTARVAPAGRYDACFPTRSSHSTGEIQAHELAWSRAGTFRRALGSNVTGAGRAQTHDLRATE
jgi:hypothetical protein